MVCPDCGSEIKEDEKYCIQCGAPIIKNANSPCAESEDTDTVLQIELLKIFNSNKVMSFILKYSTVFVLAYPIFILMGRFEVFDNIYEFISNYTIILHYAYNFGLLGSYTNKKFEALFGALALRVLNSSILIFQSSTPWGCVFRISIIIISAMFVYKKLMTDSQRSALIGKFKASNVTCINCGCSVKTTDIFCPKCGNRM